MKAFRASCSIVREEGTRIQYRLKNIGGRAKLRHYSSDYLPKIKSSPILRKPQYDFKKLKSLESSYVDSSIRRNLPESVITGIRKSIELHDQWMQVNNKRNNAQAERNRLQNELLNMKDQKPQHMLKHLSGMKSQVRALESLAEELEVQLMTIMDQVPNLISEDSLIDQQQVVGMINEDRKREASESYDHLSIGLKLGIIDLESASRTSGSSWYYLLGDGALLEIALVQYALSRARQNGFQLIIPPSIVRQEIAHACGFRPRDTNGEQQIYNLEGSSNLCLTGTAEIPMAAWAAHKTLTSDHILKKVGVSRSYRAEAGARGKGTKGLYRVHEFTKVELFAWTQTEQEAKECLESIRELQQSIISDLGLCARILNMPPDDLGAPAYKKYDIEAWMPGRGGWGEVTSASNCLDYQARRMHTKFKGADGSVDFANTLNGTAMAVPRVILAIIENYYDPDTNRVEIPAVLRPWMDGMEYIG